VDGSDNLYSTGYGTDGAGNNHRVTRKSSDQGSSWSTVDDFFYPGSTYSAGYAVGVDSFGNVYSFGDGTDVGGNNRWVTRKSADQGSTWSIADDFLYAGGTASGAKAFGKDAAGNLYSSGYGFDGSSIRWVTRKLSCTGYK
jgi:hypothetical protein